MENSKKIWVFGYGSLVWKPGFSYTSSSLGFICGYERRFWQGNTAQRGSPSTPGRVATLVENTEGKTWGRAFELSEEDTISSLSYLDNREKTLGGYTSVVTSFYGKDSNEVFQVLVYIATPQNEHYLGPAPLPKIAKEVVRAKGLCGHNVEYVIRLAEYFRKHLPEGCDEHLHYLDRHIRTRLKSKKINIEDLMTSSLENGLNEVDVGDGLAHGRDSFKSGTLNVHSDAFSSRIPSRSLKCVSV